MEAHHVSPDSQTLSTVPQALNSSSDREGQRGAGKMAQLADSLLCRGENVRSILSTHIKKKKSRLDVVALAYNFNDRRVETRGCPGLVASQSSQISELQVDLVEGLLRAASC